MADGDRTESAWLRGRCMWQGLCPSVTGSLGSPAARRCGYNSLWPLRIALPNRLTRMEYPARTGAETLQVVEPAQLSARYTPPSQIPDATVRRPSASYRMIPYRSISDADPPDNRAARGGGLRCDHRRGRVARHG